MVVVAYLGWAAYGSATILFLDRPPSFSLTISGVALVALCTSWTLFAVQKYPLTFYIYVVFPCYFWREALVTSSGPLLQLYRSGKWQGSMKVLLRAIFVIAALQIMVVRVSIFTYTERNWQPPVDSHE
jgi:phosphatidylinositol glycan class N